MKAAYITRFGGPEVFNVGDMATPPVRPGHVLVRVEAAARDVECRTTPRFKLP